MNTSNRLSGRSGVALSAALLVFVALSAVPVVAHHSTAAFDSNRIVRIEGKVTQFRWINPHTSFKLEGTAEGGPDGLWTVEMTAANVLVNQGWKRSSLTVGDDIVAFVNPLRNSVTLNDGSQGGLYVGVILADGSKLGRTDGDGEYSDE